MVARVCSGGTTVEFTCSTMQRSHLGVGCQQQSISLPRFYPSQLFPASRSVRAEDREQFVLRDHLNGDDGERNGQFGAHDECYSVLLWELKRVKR